VGPERFEDDLATRRCPFPSFASLNACEKCASSADDPPALGLFDCVHHRPGARFLQLEIHDPIPLAGLSQSTRKPSAAEQRQRRAIVEKAAAPGNPAALIRRVFGGENGAPGRAIRPKALLRPLRRG
jgi:hypothetical protein